MPCFLIEKWQILLGNRLMYVRVWPKKSSKRKSRRRRRWIPDSLWHMSNINQWDMYIVEYIHSSYSLLLRVVFAFVLFKEWFIRKYIRLILPMKKKELVKNKLMVHTQENLKMNMREKEISFSLMFKLHLLIAFFFQLTRTDNISLDRVSYAETKLIVWRVCSENFGCK